MQMHDAEFLRRTAPKLLLVNARDQRQRYLAIVLVTAPSALLVWYVFHGVYTNLSESVKAVGYVDPSTQIGIDLGYAVMVGGTLALAVTALWCGWRYLRLLIRGER